MKRLVDTPARAGSPLNTCIRNLYSVAAARTLRSPGSPTQSRHAFVPGWPDSRRHCCSGNELIRQSEQPDDARDTAWRAAWRIPPSLSGKPRRTGDFPFRINAAIHEKKAVKKYSRE
ncbi:hypothetical protein [Paraburkholderia tropica]|uniref:hypothetical protein n=1 Tax=Paraburkholderia tropica TaxID=92647 RepID=UPI001E5A8689|nr:hypothetical protein [Paraburkholderia tropica]